MSIIIKEGDLFDAPMGLICHQVNCKGKMNKGVAKIFKEKFPYAFEQYADTCHEVSADLLLGNIQISKFNDNVLPLIIPCCMFAQDDWRGQNICNTQYWAFRSCCRAITCYINNCEMPSLPINMPYGIGAGLGGGDWQIIYSIIEEELADYNVILWKLNI